MASILAYTVLTIVIIGLCLLGMSVGLIFRDKTFRACGNAARDFDGEPIQCAACGGQGDPKTCRRKRHPNETC